MAFEERRRHVGLVALTLVGVGSGVLATVMILSPGLALRMTVTPEALAFLRYSRDVAGGGSNNDYSAAVFRDLLEAYVVWAGFFFLCLASTILWSVRQVPDAVRWLYRAMAALWVFDGVYVKFITFGSTGLFLHPVLTGSVDVCIGAIFAFLSTCSKQPPSPPAVVKTD